MLLIKDQKDDFHRVIITRFHKHRYEVIILSKLQFIRTVQFLLCRHNKYTIATIYLQRVQIAHRIESRIVAFVRIVGPFIGAQFNRYDWFNSIDTIGSWQSTATALSGSPKQVPLGGLHLVSLKTKVNSLISACLSDLKSICVKRLLTSLLTDSENTLSMDGMKPGCLFIRQLLT